MARRKSKSRRRRSPKTISLYEMAVAYGNMSILSEGMLGTSPVGFVTGATDLGYKTVADQGLGVMSRTVSGANVISLGDIFNEPGLAMSEIMANAKENAVPMALASITLNTGAKIFRKVMRKPFNQANRVIRPLGLGVRL